MGKISEKLFSLFVFEVPHFCQVFFNFVLAVLLT